MPNPLDLIYRNINSNRTQLKHLLDQLTSNVINEHELSSAKLLMDLEKVKDSEDAEQKLLNLSIVYTDNFRKLARKIDNLIVDKNVYLMRNDQIVSHHSSQFSENEQQHYRQVFAKICNYELKGNEEMTLYKDPKFCSYVLSKTFKKTFNELYDFLAIAIDKKIKDRLDGPVTIAAIGGGPGNDGLAIATFLRTRLMIPNSTPINVKVFDLSSEAWSLCTSDIVNKLYSSLNIDVSWLAIDHTKEYGLGDLKADFISACWTLNEHKDFNAKFWNALVAANTQSIFAVIEGEVTNIDKLYASLVGHGFDSFYYEKFANPRKLLGYKSAVHNQGQSLHGLINKN
jgi:hypothetical protein